MELTPLFSLKKYTFYDNTKNKYTNIYIDMATRLLTLKRDIEENDIGETKRIIFKNQPEEVKSFVKRNIKFIIAKPGISTEIFPTSFNIQIRFKNKSNSDVCLAIYTNIPIKYYPSVMEELSEISTVELPIIDAINEGKLKLQEAQEDFNSYPEELKLLSEL